MKEEKNLFKKEESSLIVPGIIVFLFLVAMYVTYIRVYKSNNVYYFMSEAEVENFHPLGILYGNN